jgi:hypothetical protein
VKVEPGRPYAKQEAAFDHRWVQDIVDALQEQKFDARLIRVARQGVISPDAATADELVAELRRPATDPLVVAAVKIAQAGARIAREKDEELHLRLLGAVLERLIWAMCADRKPAETSREVHVVLVPNKHQADARSGRMDVVVDSTPFEAYECKFGGKVGQGDIDDLGAIYVTAASEGLESTPCVATWGSRWQLDAWIKLNGIQLDERLFYVDQDELARNVVRDRAPSARLR